jgi:hypothetical protein
MHIKFGDETFDYELDEQLKSLTGLESAEIEDFLGGWDNFRQRKATAKTSILLVWLGKRAAGQTTTLEEIGNTPGLLFGDVFEVLEGEDDEPENPMEEPSRPLAERNGDEGSSDGNDDSVLSLATSADSGMSASSDSTA